MQPSLGLLFLEPITTMPTKRPIVGGWFAGWGLKTNNLLGIPLFIHWYFSVSLSEVDRQLLQRCLDRGPRAWQDFVDRFLGLVVHVANHTAESRGLTIDGATRDDLVSEVFLTLVTNDFAVLRRFRRNCSLATYLTVISRRVIVRRLRSASQPPPLVGGGGTTEPPRRIENQEEVQKLLLRLDPKEANVVRMYHLEGKTYEEIGKVVGMSVNSVGPVLSRARDKMRNGSADSA